MLPYSKDESGKYRDYGFVHYKERASALEAVARSEDDKPVVDGKELTVSKVNLVNQYVVWRGAEHT